MAREPGKHPRTGRTRRRGAALDEAILRAAADDLTASGYAGLTMEKVARRAGTNKNALYRRRANRHWSSPLGGILRELISAAGGAPQLPAELPEQLTDALAANWLIVLGRAVARGEAAPEALHPRVATTAIVLLRNEFVMRGIPTAPDEVLVEIVDRVYLPLVQHRNPSPG